MASSRVAVRLAAQQVYVAAVAPHFNNDEARHVSTVLQIDVRSPMPAPAALLYLLRLHM
jgi:hypothetical protein